MLPSASLGEGSFGLYEPIHGSAPKYAGLDRANPIATILSAAMMLRYTFSLKDEADAIENAVSAFLKAGYRTPDIMAEGFTEVGTKKAGELIASMV
jgi:3-isopropylmalate dehydrogenase